MPSRYYRARLDIGRGGERFVCEDLRAGCPGLLADDGAGKDYDYLSIVTTPDSGPAVAGAAPSCVAAAAVEGAGARPRGRGVRFSVRPRATVEVFRQTLHGRITRQMRVARFPRRARAFTWNGRATVLRPACPLEPGTRRASAAPAAGQARHARPSPPAGASSAAAPSARHPLPPQQRRARRGVTVTGGRRLVRRPATRNRAAGRTVRLRLPARDRARGAHRVTITARTVGGAPQTVRLTAIRY